jgi:acetoin utilization protein AcuB
MTRLLVTVTHDTAAATAWEMMRARGIRHLPVLDRERRLIGMVSDRDLWQAILARWVEAASDVAGALDRLRVDEAMSWGVVTVGPETDLRRAARIMHERRLGALPVAAQGRIVGLVTAADLVPAALGATGRGSPRAARPS